MSKSRKSLKRRKKENNNKARLNRKIRYTKQAKELFDILNGKITSDNLSPKDASEILYNENGKIKDKFLIKKT